MEPETLLEEEPEDAVNKLKSALRVCGMLKTVYFGYKVSKTPSWPKSWAHFSLL